MAQQREDTSAMMLQGIEPAHDHVEQPLARRASLLGIGQRKRGGRPAEAEQDCTGVGEAQAGAVELQAGVARRGQGGDAGPALTRGDGKGAPDQGVVEFVVGHAWAFIRPCAEPAVLRFKASSPFLKKRTKKLLFLESATA